MGSVSYPSGTRVLLLCVHNHQPVGNFDSVLEEASDRSYLPFLETLAFFPSIKVTLHYSGFLLRWLAENRPDVFGLLKDLVSRGQVEMLGGGMYEPVMPLLPERDRRGQIQGLSDLVGRTFGKVPRGIWLAERVWEPELPASLAAAGVEYLPLDDFHFLRAGVAAEELDGIYLTETNGAKVRLFPGSERLRYLIPFWNVEEALREVEQLTSRDVPFPAAILADDGEKFGVWPGTYDTVFTKGWLRRFFEGIVAREEWLTTMTLAEYADAAPLRGKVYLPSCSYLEMGEWALPPSSAARFGGLLHDFRSGRYPEVKPFAQGGSFRGFLRKYEEANQLHKRMLWVSGRVKKAAERGGGEEARDFLYRAQCNDVYWHGIFGGLYLNHLREAAYANLLRAEAASDRALHDGREGWTEAASGDLDADGGEEALLKTPHVTLLVHGHDGGAMTEISLPRRGIALGHVLTRREEAYHRKFKDAGGRFDGRTSIHDLLVLKDPSVAEALAVDPWQRASFREAFYREEDPLDGILNDGVRPLCVTAGVNAKGTITRSSERIHLAMEVPMRGEGAELALGKVLSVEAGKEGFEARYRLRNDGDRPAWGKFVSEWNFNFLSGDGSERRYEGIGEREEALSSRGSTAALRWFRIVDGWRKIAVSVTSDRDFALLRHPVETASLSETGVEKIHQGVCLRLLFPVRLRPGEMEEYFLSWSVISVAF
ncbi:MAG TPA: alpha-amylase/4-alpha-glucanotransferase domain-containing protein [Candidatus Deferrimicrobiaceae bacterium]|nr:alpha-amylase/4-alpha-glucanotransferase domain-containing protein [Candidatus Deferrimicrobiaceae bacterium]